MWRDITLRPASSDDEPFLRRLILDTIAGELGAGAWPEPMRGQLLEMQYKGRRHPGGEALPGARSYVIDADGSAAGWLFLTELPHEMRIVEIMVLPDMRNRGAGGTAIAQVLALAAAARKPVRLNVNVLNPQAIRLYERLGFRRIDGDEVQSLMEKAP